MIKVLIADDENLICQMIYKMIDWKAKGLSVCGFAGNGFEVLEKVRTEQPDIVITDIRMPVLGGLEAAQEIRRLSRKDHNLPIVALTADAYTDTRDRAKEVGMDAFVTKPVYPRELYRILEEVMKEG